MAILSTGNIFGDTDTVTSTKLNNIVNAATFSDPVDDSTLELYSGKLRIKDNGVTLQKLATAVKDALYPIGSIYTNATDSTNPATLIGFGTWVAFGAGRVLIGEGSDSDNQPTPETVSFTAGDEGGEYNHTLDLDEMPSHRHGGIQPSGTTGSNSNGFDVDSPVNGGDIDTYQKFTKYAGGAGSDSNGTLTSAGDT